MFNVPGSSHKVLECILFHGKCKNFWKSPGSQFFVQSWHLITQLPKPIQPQIFPYSTMSCFREYALKSFLEASSQIHSFLNNRNATPFEMFSTFRPFAPLKLFGNCQCSECFWISSASDPFMCLFGTLHNKRDDILNYSKTSAKYVVNF